MKPASRGRLEEHGVEGRVGQLERDVHPGAGPGLDPVRIEARRVDRPVQALGLAFVPFSHGRDPAFALDPLEHQDATYHAKVHGVLAMDSDEAWAE